MEFVLSLGLGVGLAVACGIRVFLPVLVMGLAAVAGGGGIGAAVWRRATRSSAPPGVDDAIERPVLLAKIEEGLAQLDRGDGIPHEETKRRLEL